MSFNLGSPAQLAHADHIDEVAAENHRLQFFPMDVIGVVRIE